MWFIFPQLSGLGRSPTSIRYSVRSLDEARAYLDHPVLGPRLVEAANTVLLHGARPVEDIFGGVDAVKLRSSMTLFAVARPADPVFQRVLDQFFAGARDEATLRLLTTRAEDGPSSP